MTDKANPEKQAPERRTYIILGAVDAPDEPWTLLAQVPSYSRDAALLAYLAESNGARSEALAQFVAIPESAWHPARLQVTVPEPVLTLLPVTGKRARAEVEG